MHIVINLLSSTAQKYISLEYSLNYSVHHILYFTCKVNEEIWCNSYRHNHYIGIESLQLNPIFRIQCNWGEKLNVGFDHFLWLSFSSTAYASKPLIKLSDFKTGRSSRWTFIMCFVIVRFACSPMELEPVKFCGFSYLFTYGTSFCWWPFKVLWCGWYSMNNSKKKHQVMVDRKAINFGIGGGEDGAE